MAKDFRASQVQTSKIVASGSTGTGAKILVYPIDAELSSNPNTGQIDPNKFAIKFGSDTFIFISGAVGSAGVPGSHGAAVFGGDVYISGNLNVSGANITSDWFLLPSESLSDRTFQIIDEYGGGTFFGKAITEDVLSTNRHVLINSGASLIVTGGGGIIVMAEPYEGLAGGNRAGSWFPGDLLQGHTLESDFNVGTTNAGYPVGTPSFNIVMGSFLQGDWANPGTGAFFYQIASFGAPFCFLFITSSGVWEWLEDASPAPAAGSPEYRTNHVVSSFAPLQFSTPVLGESPSNNWFQRPSYEFLREQRWHATGSEFGGRKFGPAIISAGEDTFFYVTGTLDPTGSNRFWSVFEGAVRVSGVLVVGTGSIVISGNQIYSDTDQLYFADINNTPKTLAQLSVWNNVSGTLFSTASIVFIPGSGALIVGNGPDPADLGGVFSQFQGSTYIQSQGGVNPITGESGSVFSFLEGYRIFKRGSSFPTNKIIDYYPNVHNFLTSRWGLDPNKSGSIFSPPGAHPALAPEPYIATGSTPVSAGLNQITCYGDASSDGLVIKFPEESKLIEGDEVRLFEIQGSTSSVIFHGQGLPIYDPFNTHPTNSSSLFYTSSLPYVTYTFKYRSGSLGISSSWFPVATRKNLSNNVEIPNAVITASKYSRTFYDPTVTTEIAAPVAPFPNDTFHIKNKTTSSVVITINGNGAEIENPVLLLTASTIALSAALISINYTFYDGKWYAV